MSIFEDPEEWADYGDDLQFSNWGRLRLNEHCGWKKVGFLVSPAKSGGSYHYNLKTRRLRVLMLLKIFYPDIRSQEITPRWQFKVRAMNLQANKDLVDVRNCASCGELIPAERYLSQQGNTPRYCCEKCAWKRKKDKPQTGYYDLIVMPELPKGLMKWGADIRPAAPGVFANSPEFDPMTFTPVEIAMEREGFMR